MIGTSNVIVTASLSNPDKDAIVNKRTIDISLLESDVSSSGLTVKINPSTSQVRIQRTTQVDEFADDFDPSKLPDVSFYYTPIYSEKINYNIWKTRINKTFQELEAI